MYDPAIARFTGVDPIAEDFAHLSTYNYADNNPIRNIDLHGLQGYSKIEAHTFDDGTKSAHVTLNAPVISAIRTHAKGTGLHTNGAMPISQYTRGIIDPAVKGMGGTLLAAIGGSLLSMNMNSSLGAASSKMFSSFYAKAAANFSIQNIAVDAGVQSIFNLAQGKNIVTNYNFISGGSSAIMGPFSSSLVGSKFSSSINDPFSVNSTSGAIVAGIVGGGLGKLSGNFSSQLSTKFKLSGVDGYGQSFELVNPIATLVGGTAQGMAKVQGKLAQELTDE